MRKILDIPVELVVSLMPARAVEVTRAILRAECGYAKLSPEALTISQRIYIADGGVDAEIKVPEGASVPSDCMFVAGITGYQIKAGVSFKPWTRSAIRSELLGKSGELASEVASLLERGGRYALLCTGHDLTPAQSNDSRRLIAAVIAEAGFDIHEDRIQVFGASQIAEIAERYPRTAALLTIDPIQEALTLEEWERDAHMGMDFEASDEQFAIIGQIREAINGECTHIRVLGEPGLGKTRVVLEAVKNKSIAPYVLYFQHGPEFIRTRLFRQLLQGGHDKPLVLVVDELPESSLSEIWSHLKTRCGRMKLVTMDHGQDGALDQEILRLEAPRLSDKTIKKILSSQVGESYDLDRWVAICDGSPRVAQAVAENLRANPGDLLKPPATIPLWDRFLHGYGGREESSTRQIDCVAQHLALFSRFGYEAPVADEGIYIAKLVERVDPTIGWARFQEVVKELRERRVLQGSRTLFFVPKALHIYLWKRFWEQYGRGFDFARIFVEMPASLHSWFLNMFRYGEDKASQPVVSEILSTEGIFSEPDLLTSGKGARFLNILAEANSGAVLKLLEATVGTWNDEQLLSFTDHRQNIVWALEKIAVWPPFTLRALRLLKRLAINENSEYGNNATGTLIGLFRIGPEAAATEASPEDRLPAALELLRSSDDEGRRLGLRVMEAAMETSGLGFRLVGPEYQGIRERAKLWIPKTYGEWWSAWNRYFELLLKETGTWPEHLRPEVCKTLLDAIQQQLTVPASTDLAFSVLTQLTEDPATDPRQLHHFFWCWREYKNNEEYSAISRRLRSVERRYVQRNIASRFRRYVVDVEALEWDQGFRERHGKPKNHAVQAVNALAGRVVRNPDAFAEIRQLLAPDGSAPALWHFGEQLALNDRDNSLLSPLINVSLETKHQVCLHGYLAGLKSRDSSAYRATLIELLSKEETAWLGAAISLYEEFDDELFSLCLSALDNCWIGPEAFSVLRFGQMIAAVPGQQVRRLLERLSNSGNRPAVLLLVELLEGLRLDDSSPFAPEFVFEALRNAIPEKTDGDPMHGYYWKKVCTKLIEWNSDFIPKLLNSILSKMGDSYELSYAPNVSPLASELVQADPEASWGVIKKHLEEKLPKWSSSLLHWLKGGLSGFDERVKKGPIADIPESEILDWIEDDPEPRSVLIAHAVPGTLDDAVGGRLTRQLLSKYSQFDGVRNGISASFHSGGWSGPMSAHLRRERGKLLKWLAAGYDSSITKWIENEVEHLEQRIEDAEIDEERSRFE